MISDRGALGEHVVNIGLTRRLDPLDRINELGDASVPFRFDVHAIFGTSKAFSLEHPERKRISFRSPRRGSSDGRKFRRVSLFAWESVPEGAWQNAEFLAGYESQGRAVSIPPSVWTQVEVVAARP